MDRLKAELVRRLPGREIQTDAANGSIVLTAAHEDVGDVTILDDGDELTVYIGDITHGHFGDYAPGISHDEQMRAIVDGLVCFVEDLVADRVLIWRSDRSGGWDIIESEEQLKVHSDAGTQFYLWSGPIG